MLSQSDNELLTRVGPGTPMGELLRRFWIPGLLEEEVPEPDCPPVRLRLLGEDLVAYKDTEGRIGILDNYCAHRRASLFFGRNEEGGLRCVYHGWKFNVEGRCVDMPSEPAESNFKDKVRITSYPAVARGGIVWLYMGPAEHQPELPQFEWSLLPDGQRVATKRLEECNWAQAVEGGIDSSHISFLHRNLADLNPDAPKTLHQKYAAGDRSPSFTIKQTDYGFMVGAKRNAEEGQQYWRITQFLTPFYTMIPPVLVRDTDSRSMGYGGHAWVPIDDDNTWTWNLSANPHRPYEESSRGGGLEEALDAKYRPLRNRDNDYELDREMQRSVNYTGIVGINTQDRAVQESMGRTIDRSAEHLGTTDAAVIAFRRRLMRMALALQEGVGPAEAVNGDWYRVRSASAVLPAGVPFEVGAAPLLTPSNNE